MDATRVLRDEHRLILRVLDAFEASLAEAEASGRLDGERIQRFLEFFRDFADGCHHAKEEDQLFVALGRIGVTPEGGPIAMVLEEHDHGRDFLAALRAALQARAAADPDALKRLVSEGRAYITMLRHHIDKEEHCLFGMAEQALRGEDLAALLHSYREVEAQPGYAEAHERGRKVAEQLIAPREDGARLGGAAGERSDAASAGDAASSVAEELAAPGWREYSARLDPDAGTELAGRVERVLASPPVETQRALLARLGSRIEPTPLLWKLLPGSYLRLFFPVTGTSDALEEGTVVAIVLLYDVAGERTLYAHPVHAGPGANPLLKHLGGPMANPKAQDGPNGEAATRRLLEHKHALWPLFLEERESLGAEEAGRRWRDRYAWSLVRLYFCERCSACRWGCPSLEGAGGEPWRGGETTGSDVDLPLPPNAPAIIRAIHESEPWAVEVAYAQRGGFTLDREPQLVAPIDDEHSVAVFGSDAEFLEGGTLVGAIAYVHEASARVLYVHCLSAGPEPEMIFLRGDRALGLPVPQPGPSGDAAREAYAHWRRRAWSRFWVDELEDGLDAASGRWLRGYREALARLFAVGV